MCELFAVNSARPARVRLRFAEFALHGAHIHGGNPDGWGAAYFDGADAHVLREPMPAVQSAFVRVLEDHDFHSTLVLAHVRRASRGPVALANTQPFSRELAGRRHAFAHNGDLPDIQTRWPLGPGCWRPIGQTDSEHVFCQLLRMLAPLWQREIPSVEARLDVMATFAEGLRPIGPANFLYTDGDVLFAHAHRRRQADGVVRTPGLHLLRRKAAGSHVQEAAGMQVRSSHAGDHPLTMLASVPLGGGNWEALAEGEIVALREGRLIARRSGGLA
ncbi:MAG: class II glutamine amidotransferase [Betaproteobacteria bacterium]|nr:class II glutamine amidotransferase [Betaproteobacteria bacterium]